MQFIVISSLILGAEAFKASNWSKNFNSESNTESVSHTEDDSRVLSSRSNCMVMDISAGLHIDSKVLCPQLCPNSEPRCNIAFVSVNGDGQLCATKCKFARQLENMSDDSHSEDTSDKKLKSSNSDESTSADYVDHGRWAKKLAAKFAAKFGKKNDTNTDDDSHTDDHSHDLANDHTDDRTHAHTDDHSDESNSDRRLSNSDSSDDSVSTDSTSEEKSKKKTGRKLSKKQPAAQKKSSESHSSEAKVVIV